MRSIGLWLIGRWPSLGAWVVAMLVILIIGMQVGMYKGRLLEREAIAGETLAIEAAIAEEASTHEAAVASLEAGAAIIRERLRVEKIVVHIIACESDGRHKGVWGDGHRSYGVAQFQRATFRELARKADMRGLIWTRREDQIRLLRWAVANGYGYRWSCYKEAARG